MTETIRTLRVDKGFGFSAICGEGIADLREGDGADLREGDGVEFEVEDSLKGPRAASVKRTTT